MKATAPLLLAAGWLAACASPGATLTEPTSTPLQPTTASASSSETTPIPALSTASPFAAALPHYELQVIFDYAAHTLEVSERIQYSNNSSQPLDELVLVVDAEQQSAGFELSQLETLSGPVLGESKLQDGILHLPLEMALAPGETIELALGFSLALPQRNDLLGWSERQTNLIDWYPYIPPFENGEWLAHEPWRFGEYGVYESADFDVSIMVSGAPSGLLLAAPAPENREGGTWTFHLEDARRFVWSASGQYLVVSGEQDGVAVRVYCFAEQRHAAERALAVAMEALAIFNERYGPYPYESLSMVEALFADGMESDGIFFLDQYYFQTYSNSRQDYLTALTAHEVSHNWWFGQVGNDPAREPWLDESLAIYSELVYYEQAAPNLVAWWWDYRITRFDPAGWVDDSVYDHSEFAPYVRAVYMRGALFLQAVREAIGEEAFFAFLKDYVQQGAGQITTAGDFFGLLEQHSEADLIEIIAEYFKER